jgi:hypothetical protein
MERMSTATTTSPINPAHLAFLLGLETITISGPGSAESAGEKTITAEVEQEALASALAEYVFDPAWGRDPVMLAALQARARARELSAKGDFLTDAELRELAAQMQYLL